MSAQPATPLPLHVALEGALLRSDLASEVGIALLRRAPWRALGLLPRVVLGPQRVRNELRHQVELDPAVLPYDPRVLEWLGRERAAGRPLWLASREPQLAQRVAAHLGLFEGVVAASGAELPPAEHTVRRPGLASVRLLRPHQWAKNALLALPLIAAHGAGSATAVRDVALAFLAFCCCASAVYVLNDLLDVEADRTHPRKCRRPIAAGEVTLWRALAMAAVLIGIAASTTVLLPPRFALLLAGYFALTSAYSVWIKGMVMVDAICLAGLYTLRMIGGAAAAQVPLSFWMLLFSVFLFLSLAFVKRYAELDGLRRQGRLRARGRGYHVEDVSLIQSLGVSAGYLAVLVLALYINSPAIEPLYRRPKLIWALCVLLLYWISRVWVRAHRGEMHDDPVVFALKDRVSLVLGALGAVTVLAAI